MKVIREYFSKKMPEREKFGVTKPTDVEIGSTCTDLV